MAGTFTSALWFPFKAGEKTCQEFTCSSKTNRQFLNGIFSNENIENWLDLRFCLEFILYVYSCNYKQTLFSRIFTLNLCSSWFFGSIQLKSNFLYHTTDFKFVKCSLLPFKIRTWTTVLQPNEMLSFLSRMQVLYKLIL